MSLLVKDGFQAFELMLILYSRSSSSFGISSVYCFNVSINNSIASLEFEIASSIVLPNVTHP